MKLIDTHAHLQFKAYDPDRDEAVKRNSEELAAVINVGTSLETSEKAIALSIPSNLKVSQVFPSAATTAWATSYQENFYAAVGIHPHHVDQWNDQTATTLDKLA